jgi:hypothetical protein
MQKLIWIIGEFVFTVSATKIIIIAIVHCVVGRRCFDHHSTNRISQRLFVIFISRAMELVVLLGRMLVAAVMCAVQLAWLFILMTSFI